MTYDPLCYELAKQFLGDHPCLDTESRRTELAEVIQYCIEDWLELQQEEKDD